MIYPPEEGGEKPRPAKLPCGSCPYRLDVPPAIWAKEEYDKLPHYDGQSWEQSPALFMCHQREGHLCAGWLACHDTDHLLALRMNAVHPSAYSYVSPVPVFASGAEARAHGLQDHNNPNEAAKRLMNGVARKHAKVTS